MPHYRNGPHHRELWLAFILLVALLAASAIQLAGRPFRCGW